jgi:multimeric flavodoxin WrbA
MNLGNSSKPYVLGLASSPRSGGNTERLLEAFLRGAVSGWATVEFKRLPDLRIMPCSACEDCYEDGDCCYEDDATTLYDKLWRADIVALAAPIYFYHLPAQAKTLMDRCQALWARKEMLGQTRPGPRARGAFLSAAAGGGARLFEGSLLTVKYWLDSFHADLAAVRLYRRIEDVGDIALHATALRDAERLGKLLASDPQYREEVDFGRVQSAPASV